MGAEIYVCKCGEEIEVTDDTSLETRRCKKCGRLNYYIKESEIDATKEVTNLEYLNNKLTEKTREMRSEQQTRYLRHCYSAILARLAPAIHEEIWQQEVDAVFDGTSV